MRPVILLACGWLALPALAAAGDASTFQDGVAPILRRHCVRCHQGKKAGGGFDLTTARGVVEGRGEGWIVVPGKPEESYLLDVVSGEKPTMPKAGGPLSPEQIATLTRWIADGASWPEGVALKGETPQWWSLRPIGRPPLPEPSPEDRAWVRTPVDAFIVAKLREKGLSPAPEADRRTLIRRLSFDLLGLPPAPEAVEAFAADTDPRAYETLVERILDSPHYGERWARHWLDVVHYGDTHGYDKDKLRPNAWPYRDYVIRSFNEDKPYARFVREQLAGDRLGPPGGEGVAALGFLAAGPFDFVGHTEVANGTMEKERVRNIDRDDMVATTMSTFVSLTAHCARCHDHKFDPITQEDYYSLQAVFAAVDRADRPYDPDPEIARRRLALRCEKDDLLASRRALEEEIRRAAGPELDEIRSRLDSLAVRTTAPRPEFGYHSGITPAPGEPKWVQVDLGRSVPIAEIVLVGAHDDFAGIGAGFGFPVRYRLEVADDPEFRRGMTVVVDRTAADVPNPGIAPQRFRLEGATARYVRLTATKLAERRNDFILAMAELQVRTPDGANAASGASVTALDSIEAPPRWGAKNLVDGIYRGAADRDLQGEMARLAGRRDALLARHVDEATRRRRAEITQGLARVEAELSALPPPRLVYAAAAEFPKVGNFMPTHGKPRPIHVLSRGDEKSPRGEVGPGAVGCVPGLPSRFAPSPNDDESARRAALADWIADPRNPLTWRSIVNRVWYYHFGRGIVETPNDFGRMGAEPTHPALLDWLAVEFRDGGQSIKDLHRLIVSSATYRQSSASREDAAEIDAGNRYLWRMNRGRLEAEAIRDAVLAVGGALRREMGGPGFRPFAFKDDHSPRYLYAKHDPADPASHRRSVYRFIVRSVPDPLMNSLDCADPSLLVDRRNETLTPLQALALLNNRFMLFHAERFAGRVAAIADDTPSRIRAVYRLALQREPDAEELAILVPLAERHGLENLCRLIFNSNEFIFVD